LTTPAPLPDLRLVVLTDAALAAPRTVEEVVVAALQAGAPAIQLRDKTATAADLHRQATRLRELTRRHGALLFINDRLDVALAADADGVHLGPHDLPVEAARNAARRAGRPRFLIGASTDDPHTARRLAAAGASYLGCGAVFGTTSKPDVGDEHIGTRRLADVVAAVDIPVVGIGGITPANVHQIAAAGSTGAAVLGAIMTSDDVEATVQALLHPFA
jgi:thiamine-phosphate pyrophosphorylase